MGEDTPLPAVRQREMALAANQSLWAQDFRLVTFGRELTVQAKAWASALNAEWDRAWSRSGGRCGRSWRRSVTPPTKMVRGRTHLAFSNTAPDPQQDGWHHAEVV